MQNRTNTKLTQVISSSSLLFMSGIGLWWLHNVRDILIAYPIHSVQAAYKCTLLVTIGIIWLLIYNDLYLIQPYHKP